MSIDYSLKIKCPLSRALNYFLAFLTGFLLMTFFFAIKSLGKCLG